MNVIEVEAEYSVWKEYAKNKELHPAIINFLDINKDYFYGVETTVKGKNYITARGWEDLSEMIKLYEESGLEVKSTLVEQYIRNERVVREFSAYYELFKKYRSTYRINEILNGTITDEIVSRASKASLDERLSVMGMLIDNICHEIRENIYEADVLKDVLAPLKAIKALSEGGKSVDEIRDNLYKIIDARKQALVKMESAGAVSNKDRSHNKDVIKTLTACSKEVEAYDGNSSSELFARIKSVYDAKMTEYKKSTMSVKERLHNAFVFVEKAFEDGNEMLILMTELTVIPECVKFITMYGCEDYNRHNEDMMLSNKSDDILKQIEDLDNL